MNLLSQVNLWLDNIYHKQMKMLEYQKNFGKETKQGQYN